MHVTILDLQITHDASHIVVRLEDNNHVPLMCLHNTPATDVKSNQVDVKFVHVNGKRMSRQESRRLSPAVSIQFNNDVLFIDTNRSGGQLKVRILNGKLKLFDCHQSCLVMDTALWLIVTDCCSKQRVHLD
jgi:hypothetical protein